MSALARPTLCSLRPPRLATGTRAAKRYVRRPEIVFFEPSFAFRRRVTFVVSCGGRGFRVRRGRDSPHAPRGVVCHELRLGQVPYRADVTEGSPANRFYITDASTSEKVVKSDMIEQARVGAFPNPTPVYHPYLEYTAVIQRKCTTHIPYALLYLSRW